MSVDSRALKLDEAALAAGLSYSEMTTFPGALISERQASGHTVTTTEPTAPPNWAWIEAEMLPATELHPHDDPGWTLTAEQRQDVMAFLARPTPPTTPVPDHRRLTAKLTIVRLRDTDVWFTEDDTLYIECSSDCKSTVIADAWNGRVLWVSTPEQGSGWFSALRALPALWSSHSDDAAATAAV